MEKKRVLTIALAVAGAILVLAGGAGYWVLSEAKSSDAVGADAALEEFRAADDGTRDVAGAPAPGVYTYSAVGAEGGGGGSVGVDRDLPAEAQLTVWQQAGGYETRLSYSDDHLEGARYTVGQDGTSQTWTRTRLTLFGSTSDDEFPVSPEALFVPADVAEGDTWDASYETGDFTTNYASTVIGAEPVTVNGTEIDALVIERITTYEGSLSGGWTDTFWWSPELSLSVKIKVEGESKQGFGFFKQDSEITLVSTEPQV